MRTTLNLDEDVAAELEQQAHQHGRSRSRVANDLIRAGLQATRAERRSAQPYRPPVFDTGRPLIDVTDIGATLDLLDGT